MFSMKTISSGVKRYPSSLSLSAIALPAFARPMQLRRIMFGLCLAALASPMYAQFSATGISIDPTTGAQQLFTAILHGGILIAAICGIGALLYGIFRLVSGRPMEGILEIALGIIVLGLIGNALNWGTALTGQAIAAG